MAKFVGLLSLVFAGSAFADNQCAKQVLPLTFSANGLPFATVVLNGEEHSALLDLGTDTGLHIPESMLAKFPNKQPTGNHVQYANVLGEVNVVDEYVIPSLSLGCFALHNLHVLALKPWAASIGDENPNSEKNEAETLVLGRELFNNLQVQISFANQQLRLQSKDQCCDQGEFEVPIQQTDNGIEVVLTSPSGQHSMVIDSGASSSIMVSARFSSDDPHVTPCEFNLGPEIACRMLTGPLDFAGEKIVGDVSLYPIDERFTADGLLVPTFSTALTFVLILPSRECLLPRLTEQALAQR